MFADDKKLGSVLKKMSMTNINAVEEVNIFKNDGTVIHIVAPKSKRRHFSPSNRCILYPLPFFLSITLPLPPAHARVLAC